MVGMVGPRILRIDFVCHPSMMNAALPNYI